MPKNRNKKKLELLVVGRLLFAFWMAYLDVPGT